MKNIANSNNILLKPNYIDKYVMNNLVCMYDAENNAGYGNHVKSLQKWMPALGNGPGRYLNDGSNFDFDVNCATGLSEKRFVQQVWQELVPQKYTIEATLVPLTNFSSEAVQMQAAFVGIGWVGSIGNTSITSRQNYGKYEMRVYDGTFDGMSDIFVKECIVTTCIQVSPSDGVKMFIDGKLAAISNKKIVSSWHGWASDWFGGGVYGSCTKLYRFSRYDRWLTDNEIEHNYLIDKERFV